MDIHELRIGNYVMGKGGVAWVSGIPFEKEEQEVGISTMRPFLLSEKFMDRHWKRGAESCDPYGKYNATSFTKWELSPGYIVALIDGRFFIVGEEGGYVFMYKEVTALHQLQNIYYDFSGKELEVRLWRRSTRRS